MFDALLEYRFLQHALLACLLASVVCGFIGVAIVEKKLVMMSGGIAHTAYGGVGLGYLLGFEPILGAAAFALLAAFAIGKVRRGGHVHTDVIIALFWSLGMALGIAFIGFAPGYPPDMSTYLFGNILTVTQLDLGIMAGFTAVVAALVVILFNDWKAYLFDGQFSAILGLRTTLLEYLLLALIALTVVVLIRVAGIILVIALLTAPAATAALFTTRLETRMALAIVFGCLFCLCGLWLSYTLNIASGATIIILSAVVYGIAYAARRHHLE